MKAKRIIQKALKFSKSSGKSLRDSPLGRASRGKGTKGFI